MSLEDLTEIARKKLVRYLESVDFVDFAILFGSLAYGKPHPGSDCDLGVATTREVSFLEAGFLVARLEEIVRKEVDLVIVNDLPSETQFWLSRLPVESYFLHETVHVLLLSKKRPFCTFLTPSFFATC